MATRSKKRAAEHPAESEFLPAGPVSGGMLWRAAQHREILNFLDGAFSAANVPNAKEMNPFRSFADAVDAGAREELKKFLLNIESQDPAIAANLLKALDSSATISGWVGFTDEK